MRKIWFSMLFVSVFIVSGCLNDADNQEQVAKMETEETAENKEISESVIKTEGKETVSVATLEKDALYVIEGKVDSSEVLLYVYAEDEENEELEVASFIGQSGDTIISGNYSFYIAEKGADMAYRQSQIAPFPFTANEAYDMFDQTVVNGYPLFALFSHDSSVNYAPLVFAFMEGELQEVTLELDAIFSPRIKGFDDDKLQVVQYLNNDPVGWVFRTYAFKEEEMKFKEVSNIFYTDDLDYMDHHYDAGEAMY